MPLRIPHGWELPESRVTPEALVLGRRAALAAAAGLALAARPARAQEAAALIAGAQKNTRYEPGRAVTAEREGTSYNNYYEFGTSKDIVRAAQRLPLRPWSVRFEGMVEQPREMALDDLLRTIPQEERIYRLRCVEGWSMVLPWTGFPLSALVRLAAPTAAAKYVVFETAALLGVMPGLRAPYPWPYVEAVTMEEAMNDLAFIATGLYGKPLQPQNGAPVRLVLPWKYGFKSGKSLVRVRFTDRRPTTFWEALGPSEYGFWANVNPAVAHPPLEPGHRAGDRHRRPRADADLQRLRRVRGRAVRRQGRRAAVHVGAG